MPEMSFEEACTIMRHCDRWLFDVDGEHNEAVLAAIHAAERFPTIGPQTAALFGFVIGRAYGVREERQRRRKVQP